LSDEELEAAAAEVTGEAGEAAEVEPEASEAAEK
jgi:hypothetical protein